VHKNVLWCTYVCAVATQEDERFFQQVQVSPQYLHYPTMETDPVMDFMLARRFDLLKKGAAMRRQTLTTDFTDLLGFVGVREPTMPPLEAAQDESQYKSPFSKEQRSMLPLLNKAIAILKGLTYDTALENVTTRKVNSLEDILE
jgi:hypothetical protein